VAGDNSLQCPVQGGAADAEMGGDGGHRLATGLAGASDVELVGGEHGRPPTTTVGGGSGPQPVEGAFADQLALHLRCERGDGEQQPVSQACAVGPMNTGAHPGQDLQDDAPGVQLVFDDDQQLLHGAGDPVRLVDHQGVAELEPVEGGAQLRPVRQRRAPRPR